MIITYNHNSRILRRAFDPWLLALLASKSLGDAGTQSTLECGIHVSCATMRPPGPTRSSITCDGNTICNSASRHYSVA